MSKMKFLSQWLSAKRISEDRLRIAALVLALLLIVVTPQVALAAPVTELPQTKITVNSVSLALDPQNPAIEVNSRILVPMRIIMEALGAEIDWDDVSQTVTASVPGYIVVLRIGNNRVTQNNVDSYLDVIPMLYNGRTYVPVRFVGEAVGATVDYDPVSGNVTILKSGVGVITPSVQQLPALPSNLKSMSVSSGFNNGAVIPTRYQSSDVSGGLGMSPQVSWNAFSGAQSYVVAMVDTTSGADGHLHWLLVTTGNVSRISENASVNITYPDGVEELIGYDAPYLDPEDNRHDFSIQVIALSTSEPDLSAVSDYIDLVAAVSPIALAQGTVSGYINYGKEITPAPARPGSLNVNSTAMASSGIPLKYTDSYTETAEGDGISIPVSWNRGPNGTLTYALILIDTTAGMDNYVHWLVADIPVSVTSIAENASYNESLPEDSEEIIYYEPPMVEVDEGRHTYKLVVVALNDNLEGIEGLEMVYTLEEFEAAIQGHVMARGELSSFFEVK